MDEAAIEAAKRRAGEAAAEAVADGDVVGLGTGTTAAFAIRALGRQVEAGLEIQGIATSHQSAALAREVGIPRISLADATPDLAIDGADQVADCTLLKGGGAAHAREKLVAAAADRFLVVVDERKASEELDAPVPVEVLEPAVEPVREAIAALGGEATLREAVGKDGPVFTENGNPVLDCDFGHITAPGRLVTELDGVAGLVAHGLFADVADTIYVGTADGCRTRHC